MFSNSDSPSINVIDAGADWIYPLAFPEQNISETVPLEHAGLDLTEIGIQQRTELAKERRLAVIPGSNYILIQDINYSIKRPFIHAPDIPRLLLPQRYRDKVIDRAHKEVGHISYATVTRIAEAYVWPLMRQVIRDRIAKYTTCSVHSRRTDTAVPGEMPLATSQMDFLGMDLVGPLPLSTNNNRYILAIVDHCSLWAESYPIPDKTNISVWDAFANHYLPRFACPATILTDNGWEFSGRGWEQYMLDLVIEHRRTTPIILNQMVGQTFSKKIWRHFSARHVLTRWTWEDRLGDVLWAYSISVSSVTTYSPYFLLYGRLPRVPLSRTLSVHSPDFFGNRLDNLATALQEARINMEQSRKADRVRLLARAKAGSLEKGDFVLLLANERVTLSSRFDPLWLITRIRGSTVWLHQQNTGQIRKVHMSTVRFSDSTLAWDELTVRSRRKQARSAFGLRVTDEEIVVLDPERSQANQTGPALMQPPVTTVPPLRLQRRLNDREGHTRADINQIDREGYENATVIDDDQMSVTHSGRPLKRPMLLTPSPVACKMARWEVIAFVKEFISE